MSFLDSLENSLKALEGLEQGGLDDQKRRDSDRLQAAASAPWAAKLKASPFTQTLMQKATRAGFQIRTKINFAWVGTAFRLDARDQRLELRPQPDGVAAVYLKSGNEWKREAVDLTGSPDAMMDAWVAILAHEKKQEELAAAAAEAELAEDLE